MLIIKAEELYLQQFNYKVNIESNSFTALLRRSIVSERGTNMPEPQPARLQSASAAAPPPPPRPREPLEPLSSPQTAGVPTCQEHKQTNTGTQPTKTAADLLRNDKEWKKAAPNESWVEVQRKRLRNQFVGKSGSASIQSQVKFRAADVKVPLFISNVHKEASEKDIMDYIYSKTQEKVSLFKMNMKRERGYNSYKLYVNKLKLDLFMDDKLWPNGITFRRFVSFRDKRPENEGLKRESEQIPLHT